MTNKIIVSKLGYNALFETTPDNLNFSSDYNTLKYYVSGNATITLDRDGVSRTSETVVAHNLGYVPFFICYINSIGAGGSAVYNIVPFYQPGFGTKVLANALADSTNLYLRFTCLNGGGGTFSAIFYYKIFKNSLGL